jgi:hypothetical protein
VRKELAEQRRPEAAAAQAQRGETIAALDVETEGIGRGRDDDDLQHGGQKRRQQEMGVVEGRVEQGVLMDRDGHDRRLRQLDRLALRVAQGHLHAGAGFADCGGGPAREDAADGHVLVVVKEHDLGPTTGKGVTLQVERQHQDAVHPAGEDQVATLRQVVDLLDDLDLRGRIDRPDHGARQVGAVAIEHGDRQLSRQASTEDHGQQRHQEERQGGREEQEERPAPQPAQLAPEHEREAGPERAPAALSGSRRHDGSRQRCRSCPDAGRPAA